MRYFFFIFLFLCNTFQSCIYGNQKSLGEPIKLSLQEELALKLFIKGLVSDGAGFVLCGEKPLSFYTFYNGANALPGTEYHRNWTEMKEGLAVWKRCYTETNQGSFIFHQSADVNKISLSNELLIINRKAFLDTVAKHLILFQYKLGKSVTPEELLNKLLLENTSAIFRENQALLGIMLGYGALNSIAHERGSKLISSVSAPPVSPPYLPIPFPKTEEEIKARIPKANFLPAFGYSTAQEELEDLANSMADSSNTSMRIPFSYLKDTDETKQLLPLYVEAALKVDDLLEKDLLVDAVAKKFECNITLTKEDSLLYSPKMIHQLADIVGRSIWNHFLEIFPDQPSVSFLNEFIMGMRDAEATRNKSKKEKTPELVQYFTLLQRRIANDPVMCNHITQAATFFDKQAIDDTMKCIIPKKLYYRILKEGSQPVLPLTSRQITAHFTIKNICGEILTGTYALQQPEVLDLSNVIVGLSYGIEGMRKNELREIWIHPDFSYGFDSESGGDGQTLIVQIKLLDWNAIQEWQRPGLIPVDLQHLSHNPIHSTDHLTQLRKDHAYASGYQMWCHYQKYKGVSLEPILAAIKNFQGDQPSSIEEEEQEWLTKLDWLIYQNLL